MIALRLPDEARPDFKWPRGPVYRGDVGRLLARLNPPQLSCIGDVVTRICLSAGLKPSLAAIDGVTRRMESIDKDSLISVARSMGMRLRRVKNPRGTISLEALDAVCSSLESEPGVLLLVEGEEDLLALPAIACTRPGGVVVYGAPGLGSVVVRVSLLAAREAQVRLLLLEPTVL